MKPTQRMIASLVLLASVLALIVADGAAVAQTMKPQAEPLPRRAFFGAQLENTPPEAEPAGVLVRMVFEGHSAAAAGLLEGDVVLRVDGVPVENVGEMLERLRRRRAGERVALEYLRNGERRQVEVLLQEMPRESDPDLEILYGEIEVEGTRRRTIVTRPAGVAGRLPAVLLVGGIGCYSVDTPLGPPQGYVRIANELARRGYATLRIEKTGIGDSEGPPCAEQDFKYELAGYVEAARALHRYPFVDRDKVFLFGHSIGGVHAPLVAAAVAEDAPLAGLMVKGTVGTSWFGYEMENSRRQAALWGVAAEELEERLRVRGRCLGALMAERRSPAAILAEHPECQEFLQFPAHFTYRQQLADLDLPGNWRQVRVPVLVIYGTSDFLTSAAEHHFIAGLVNRESPGLATLRLLENMDHYFHRAASYEESLRGTGGEEPTPFDDRIHDVLTEWMASLISKDPREVGIADTLAAFAAESAESGRFSGVVLVARDGRPLFAQAYGPADRERGLPNRLDTRFNIASVGKMFTGVAIAQLVEKGRLRYETRVGEVLSRLGNEAIEQRVTVHQLLTHTSGIPDLPDDLFNQPPEQLAGYREFFARTSLEFDPGSKRSYSNAGFVLLGLMIEELTGEPFDERISRTIFEPAGMRGASYDPDRVSLAPAAIPYRPGDSGKGWERAMISRHRGGPHGGVYATAADLTRFFIALRNGTLLSEDAARRVTTPVSGSSSAYGFGTLQLDEGERLVGHSGGDTGASADAYLYWESGYTIVILSNASPPSAHEIARHARRQVEPRLGSRE